MLQKVNISKVWNMQKGMTLKKLYNVFFRRPNKGMWNLNIQWAFVMQWGWKSLKNHLSQFIGFVKLLSKIMKNLNIN